MCHWKNMKGSILLLPVIFYGCLMPTIPISVHSPRDYTFLGYRIQWAVNGSIKEEHDSKYILYNELQRSSQYPKLIKGFVPLVSMRIFHGNLIRFRPLIRFFIGSGGDLHSFSCSVIHAFKSLLALDLMPSVALCVATKHWIGRQIARLWPREYLAWIAKLWSMEYLAHPHWSQAASHRLGLPLWFYCGERRF